MAPSLPVNGRAYGRLHAAALSRFGASKAQVALAKIIAIISASPLPTPPPHPEPDAAHHGDGDPEAAGGTKPPKEDSGFGVDLRLRLGPPHEIGGGSAAGDGPPADGVVVDTSWPVESGGDVRIAGKTAETVPAAAEAQHSLSPAVSVACGGDALTVAKSSEGECDPEGEHGGESHEEIAEGDAKEEVFAEQEGTKGTEGAEAGTTTVTTTTVTTTSSTSSRGRGRGSDGCLDLLLEAVRQVSGDAFEDDTPGAEKVQPAAATASMAEASHSPPSRTRKPAGGAGAKKRRDAEEWWIPLDLYEEETAPIVRSKRGRSQALPLRYRDSVLDPWGKPPALTRNGRAARP
ncbi:hypothetical protein MUK42_14357 [Musa troglodytarum]|uniref:Uncharacterized protein n=1 Tax=Musa troglodytarum TaxID=320322 RepID=A0A9E7L4I6_9LILI|nr:hypothetical protein MUK42_14357 [Musa troglodytarum]